MENENKVYCGDCYYYFRPIHFQMGYGFSPPIAIPMPFAFCTCKNAQIEYDTPIRKECCACPEKINKNNDCQFHSKEIITGHEVKKLFGLIPYKKIEIKEIVKTKKEGESE